LFVSLTEGFKKQLFCGFRRRDESQPVGNVGFLDSPIAKSNHIVFFIKKWDGDKIETIQAVSLRTISEEDHQTDWLYLTNRLMMKAKNPLFN
jgi:hypothetical protein